MCFRPKSRASMDQAPGPTIAKTAPRTACMIGIHGSPECEQYREKAIHTLTMAASDPATGVHKPARRSTPAPIPRTCRTAVANGGDSPRLAMPKWMSAAPVATRRSSRPTPGQPSAKPENSRCTLLPFNRIGNLQQDGNAQNWERTIPFSGDLQFDKSAL
jgi:hypothetical protein